jgi:uncharacterized iron-regulated membrane protein
MSKSKTSTLKKILSQIHLWGGLVSGIVVFMVALTGCMFVFEAEIRNFTQKESRFVEAQNTSRTSLSVISENISKEFPDKQIEQVRLYADPTRASLVKLVDKKEQGEKTKKEHDEAHKQTYGLNPYTGKLINKTDIEHDFMHYVEEMHTSLLLGEIGKNIIKANVVIFLVMLLSGLYLWFPRKKNQRKNAFNLNLKGKLQIINYSIHNVLGFYFLFPLLLISLTGIWWAIKPVQKGVYAVMGEKMKDKKPVKSTPLAGKIFSPNDAFNAVKTQYAGWNEAHINFAKNEKDIIKVNLRYPYEVYKKANIFEFDQYSGQILKTELYANYSAADKIKHANRDLHTGQNYGLLGKLLAFFASLYAATLPITGFLIWYFRTYKKATKIPAKTPTNSSFKPKMKPVYS